MFQALWSMSSIENFLLGTPRGGNVGKKGVGGASKKDEIWNDGVYMRDLHH